LFIELVLLIEFVRKHKELKIEEFLRLGILESLRLVNRCPYIGDVLFQDRGDSLEIITSIIKIS
jgi:hypothetical protein